MYSIPGDDGLLPAGLEHLIGQLELRFGLLLQVGLYGQQVFEGGGAVIAAVALHHRQAVALAFQTGIGNLNLAQEGSSGGFKELVVAAVVDDVHAIGLGIDHPQMETMRDVYSCHCPICS